MNLLAFDTATEQMSIALAAGERVFAVESAGGALASAALIPAILSLLSQAGIRLQQLDAIAFGRGPGAFTGLRTACSVAQGLAFGADKPVLPIDTLLSVAEVARGGAVGCRVWALLDARMNEIYAAQYQHDADGWRVVVAPLLTHADVLNERWRSDPPDAVAGNALTVFEGELNVAGARLFPAAAPTATAMLALARAAWRRGEAVDAAFALPLYLRDKVALTTLERDAVRAAKEAVKASAGTAG